ncbi:hemolysin family protein [Flavobacterium sp. MFBS3-15]|uniref:hemolysin family protein n=1 Tax=Flavobacterium sp. MFBS3-15 TaxID=2989816 RepID=UPI0022361C8C|nr:hemolysin family protein [Flavobacterium sp. MFBS3-15]MCW4468696.1 hemolysin family protein [Flavobacterium sp. MFBS3-15]
METVVIIVCLLLSAFFSGMEIAWVSTNKVYLEVEKKQPDIISKILTRLTAKPALFMASLLIGNTLALVVYSYCMSNAVLRWVYPATGEMHLVWQVLLQIVIAAFILLITAEFLPKVLFQVYANRLIKFFALPAYVFHCLFFWVSKVVIAISDFLLVTVLRTKAGTGQALFSRGDLEAYVDGHIGAAENMDVADPEIELFRNAMGFSVLRAKDIMTPRTEIAAVEINDPVAELRQLFIDTGYSKIVVYEGGLDNVVGYVHAFDMFRQPKSIFSAMIRIEKAAGGILIKDLLSQLTRKRKSMAVIQDADGFTAGLVTVEDIIEELFGEIEDEHDLDEKDRVETALPGGGYIFSAGLDVAYVNEKYKMGIPEADAYNSLGGFTVYHAGRVPLPGGKLVAGGFEIIVRQASAKNIRLLEVRPVRQ